MKLYFSIPEKWESNIPCSHFQRTLKNYLEIVKENCRDMWQFTKKVYLYLIGGIFLKKHQRWWVNDLYLVLIP